VTIQNALDIVGEIPVLGTISKLGKAVGKGVQTGIDTGSIFNGIIKAVGIGGASMLEDVIKTACLPLKLISTVMKAIALPGKLVDLKEKLEKEKKVLQGLQKAEDIKKHPQFRIGARNAVMQEVQNHPEIEQAQRMMQATSQGG
jgi:hypothetical protein